MQDQSFIDQLTSQFNSGEFVLKEFLINIFITILLSFIIRFRTAIKEPEELVYFFIAITLGLGMGADQRTLTIFGAIIVILYIIISNLISGSKSSPQNLILTISNSAGKKLDENLIIDTLKKHCSKVDLRRVDQSTNSTELSLYVEFKNMNDVLEAKKAILEIGDVQFSFIKTI